MTIKRQCLACVVVFAAGGGLAWGQSGSPAAAPASPTTAPAPAGAGPRADSERVDMLVRQLGADRWSARDDATRRLIGIGRPALPALRAALTDKELEIVFRARFIIGEILGLAKTGTAPLRGEVSAAFSKADYRTMADKAKLLVELTDTAPMLDWLWLGHSCQLAGDWPQAVKAYRNVVQLMDADLAVGIKEVVEPEPEALERSGPVRPVGPIMYSDSERKDILNQRTLLATWIAKFERFELKDANAAAQTLDNAVARLEQSKTEVDYIWRSVLADAVGAKLAAGDLAGVILSSRKLQESGPRNAFGQHVDLEAFARLIAAWPAGKPRPDIPWIFLLTEDRPSATLMPDEQATRRRSYCPPSGNPDSPDWRYAFVPPRGKEFRTIEFACDIEQIKPRHGGHFSCFCLTGGTRPGTVRIGDIDWPGDEPTGRKTATKTFEIPPGVKVVHIATGTWKGCFNMHRIDVKATFRPATLNAPPLQAGAWMQLEVLPKGGKLTWGDRKIINDSASSDLSPERGKLRYSVPGREDSFEADFEVRPGRRYGVLVNLDSPFAWQQTNLELAGGFIPPARLSVSRLKGGGCLAVWGSQAGRIMAATSDDLVNWTALAPAPFSSVFSNIEPATFADADGTVWVAFFSNRLHLQEASSAGYSLWLTSTRDGRTWSPIRPISVGRVGGWPLGGPCMLRGPDGRARMHWSLLAADGNSFGDIKELKPIVLKGAEGDMYARNVQVSVDANNEFHMVFDGNTEGVYHTTSADGAIWEKPAVILKRRNGGMEDPQLIHTKDGPLLLYSGGSDSFIMPVDLPDPTGSGQPAPPPGVAGSVKITNYVVPLHGSRLGTDQAGRIFIIAGEDTTWLLRADVKDLAARLRRPSPGAGSAGGPATQSGEGSREDADVKWSWIGPAREAPEAANWRAALEKAEKYALGEPRQREALRLYQAVLDAGPPREIALRVKVTMGARLTILYNPDLGEQSLDAEALQWCQRIIEDFKDWPNHHDLMVAKIHLGDLYYNRNDREGQGKATRLYWDVIEVPEDEIVFDDPEKANLNLDKIAVAKAPVGRMVDAKGRLLTEPTEEMNMDHRKVLLSSRRESTRALRLAAIRALAYKQGVPGDRQKTRQRLLELKQRRPDDELYQETLHAILRDFPANGEKTAPGQGQGATSRELLASSAPGVASTQPEAIVQPVPAEPGKQGEPATQPGGAAAPWEVRIAGSVVDNNGWPVEGAAVRLIAWDPAKDAMVLKHETQSAADGSFSMRAAPWVNRGRVVAGKDGFAHDWMSVPACPLLPAVRLKLEKTAAIAGRIVDGGGKPILGVTVTATTDGPGYMSGDVSGSDHQDWLIARSDEHGRFKLPDLRPNSSIDLSTLAAGFAVMERAIFAKAGQQDVTITMLPAGRIEGKVIDADTGKPLAGVGLWASEFGYRGRRPRGGACVSDEQGRFVIDGLPSGQYGIRVGLSAYLSNELLQMESLIVDVKAGTAAKAGVISLHKGNLVEVQVLDAVNGKPVMEAGVTAIDGSGQDMSFKIAGADGVCKLYLPAAASPRLRITGKDYKKLITPPFEVRKGQARRLVFRLERDNWATGKVLNRDGSGAADVIVGIYPKLREEYGVTGADGSFGVGTSCVDDKGSAIVVVRDVKRNLAGWAKLDTDRPAEIRLSPGATLIGQVVDGQGKPVPGAAMLVRLPAKDANFGGSGFEWNVVAGPDGRYEIKAVAPGLKYAINVRTLGYEWAACVVDVPADASGREVKVEHVVTHTEGF